MDEISIDIMDLNEKVIFVKEDFKVVIVVFDSVRSDVKNYELYVKIDTD